MDTVSEVANANVSQRDREKFEARCFKTSRLWQKCLLATICEICTICTIYNLTAPPARSLYTWMGPGGRYASASRIEANNALVFPPDRRMIARKSNGCRAGGCCRMGGPFWGCRSSSALPPSAGSSGCKGSCSSSLESSYPGTGQKN